MALTGLVLGPMMGRGWVILLDWPTGPRLDLRALVLAPSSLPAGPVFHATGALLQAVAGPAVGWLVPGLALVVAGISAARLFAGDGAPVVPQLTAATAYVWNPFVHERLYAGQVALLWGYALLPFLARAVLESHRLGRRRSSVRAGCWWAAAGACSMHLIVLGGVVLWGSALVAGLTRQPDRPSPRRLAGAVVTATGVCGALTAAWLAPIAGGAPHGGGTATVEAFATRADPGVGLLLGTLGQRGFWRPSLGGPGTQQGWWGWTWPLAVLVIAAVVAVGFAGAARTGRRSSGGARETAGVGPLSPQLLGLAVAGMVGWVLSWGPAGPLGGLYLEATTTVPGFGIMREAGKFLALVSLAMAAGLGAAAALVHARACRSTSERLDAASSRGRRWSAAASVALLLLPPALTPGLAWAAGGRLVASRYPSGWMAAAEVLEAEGAGRRGQGAVVVLPWQAYLDPGFTSDRIVSNPARVLFPGAVISDDAGLPGLPPSAASGRIAAALDEPQVADALAAEDVRWVVTVPGADERFGNTPGLLRLARVEGVSVYRNTRHSTATPVPGSD